MCVRERERERERARVCVHAFMGVTGVRRWVKQFKDGDVDITNQPWLGWLRRPTTECMSKKLMHSTKMTQG
jgi:hypothetical protein